MGGETIVLLDDDADLRQYLSMKLEAVGYQVLGAPNSQDVLKLLTSNRADLLISDLVMPEHEGIEGIFEVIAAYSIPIIAISAYEQYLQVIESVVTKTMLKPIKPGELINVVQELFAGEKAKRSFK